MPAGAGVKRAPRLGERVVVRVDAAERHQQAAGVRGRRDHHVVGGRVAVRLVHREHERAAGAGDLEHLQQLLGVLAHHVGIVLAKVRVRVEQLQAGNLIANDVQPRL